jgi:hypothetical protein
MGYCRLQFSPTGPMNHAYVIRVSCVGIILTHGRRPPDELRGHWTYVAATNRRPVWTYA